MVATITRAPLDLPREALVRKKYRAFVLDDGTLLPIEERVGRRLLRTVPPNSREGRALVEEGLVSFVGSEGRAFAGTGFDEILERLARKAAGRLVRRDCAPETKKSCREALMKIDRIRRALARDH